VATPIILGEDRSEPPTSDPFTWRDMPDDEPLPDALPERLRERRPPIVAVRTAGHLYAFHRGGRLTAPVVEVWRVPTIAAYGGHPTLDELVSAFRDAEACFGRGPLAWLLPPIVTAAWVYSPQAAAGAVAQAVGEVRPVGPRIVGGAAP